MKITAKFKNAFRGFLIAIKDKSVALQLLLMVAALIVSLFFDLSIIEWCVLIGCCALVIIAEMFNTVIEKMMDFIHPEKHEQVRDIKDFSAGVVLAACLFAIVIGVLIIGSKLW